MSASRPRRRRPPAECARRRTRGGRTARRSRRPRRLGTTTRSGPRRRRDRRPGGPETRSAGRLRPGRSPPSSAHYVRRRGADVLAYGFRSSSARPLSSIARLAARRRRSTAFPPGRGASPRRREREHPESLGPARHIADGEHAARMVAHDGVPEPEAGRVRFRDTHGPPSGQAIPEHARRPPATGAPLGRPHEELGDVEHVSRRSPARRVARARTRRRDRQRDQNGKGLGPTSSGRRAYLKRPGTAHEPEDRPQPGTGSSSRPTARLVGGRRGIQRGKITHRPSPAKRSSIHAADTRRSPLTATSTVFVTPSLSAMTA